MIKITAAALLTLAVVPTAQAATVAQPDLVVARHHDYWLSDRLNRLVFWKAPAAERDQSRRQ